jgi:predicted RecA/RadA family phage recombinase
MQNYIQPGNTLTLTAPSGGVTSGTGYKVGQIFVVAANDVAETLPFEGKTDGVYTLPKTTGTAWTEGLLLYWDDSTDKATTVAEDNLLIGCAAEAALSGDTTGTVRLNGIARTSGSVADDAVDTDAIANLAVTAGKLAADAVTTAKIVDDAVTAAKLADDGAVDANRAVTTNHIRDSAVTTAKVAALAVTAAKAPLFKSTEQTGTGASQNVAHGLGATPGLVWITVTEDPAGAGFDIAEGSHDATNVVVTVTSGVKFKALAWA